MKKPTNVEAETLHALKGKKNSAHKRENKAQKPERLKPTKLDLLINLLKRNNGATIKEMTTETKWQAHSVRGAISGALKKSRGLKIDSSTDGKRGRVYRILGKA